MKKIFFGLILFVLLTVNVFAESKYTVVSKVYIVNIDGTEYLASAEYKKYTNSNGESFYTLNQSIDLESETKGKDFSDPLKYYYPDGYYEYGYQSDVNVSVDAFNDAKLYGYISTINPGLYDTYISYWEGDNGLNLPSDLIFTEEQFSDENFMRDFLPKFTKCGDAVFFYTFSDKLSYSNIFDGNCESLDDFSWELVMEYLKEVYFYSGFDPGFGDGKDITNSTFVKVYDTDFSMGSNTATNTDVTYTKESMIKLAKEIFEIVDKVAMSEVCTDEDLISLRTLSNVSFFNFDEVSIPLSSECYDILFSSNGLYGKIISTMAMLPAVSTKMISQREQKKLYEYTMSYYYLESAYLEGRSLLEGVLLERQHEVKEVVRCSMFGPKTVDFLQSIFNVFKFLGVIVGTLLVTVDVFKAVVGREDAVKKNFGILLKRIGAMVALILLPFVVEIIFELVNTIGVTDPICGIR